MDQEGISILQRNCRMTPYKLSDILNPLHCSTSAIALRENFLKLSNNFKLPGYLVLRRNRLGKQGEGLVFFINTELKMVNQDSFQTKQIKGMSVGIKPIRNLS